MVKEKLHRRLLSLATVGLGVLAAAATALAMPAPAGQDPLRVCADPNNLPFSNAREEGFENALAELVARDLGKDGVSYTWWAQRRGFIRNTLKAGKCDVIMGVPPLDMIDTTRPYYRSTYVFVSRNDRHLGFSSIEAPELRNLQIGVHLIGDDGSNTPPAHVLGERDIVDNVKGYMIYGDYRQDSPPARLVEAVGDGEVDIAAVWDHWQGTSRSARRCRSRWSRSPAPRGTSPTPSSTRSPWASAKATASSESGSTRSSCAVVTRSGPFWSVTGCRCCDRG